MEILVAVSAILVAGSLPEEAWTIDSTGASVCPEAGDCKSTYARLFSLKRGDVNDA